MLPKNSWESELSRMAPQVRLHLQGRVSVDHVLPGNLYTVC
jgi:hypothetical protein